MKHQGFTKETCISEERARTLGLVDSISLSTKDIVELTNYTHPYLRGQIYSGKLPFTTDQQSNLFLLFELMLKRKNPELLRLVEEAVAQPSWNIIE